ncbi:MAG: hypothetical protein PHG82_04690 [Candidatus Gracilibacteria bacterium]|nr:hypothetical protein [Candidatus Gracilibacteria bacterium]
METTKELGEYIGKVHQSLIKIKDILSTTDTERETLIFVENIHRIIFAGGKATMIINDLKNVSDYGVDELIAGLKKDILEGLKNFN